MHKRVSSLYVAACLLAPVLAYGQAQVSYAGGLLTIRCNEIPLNQVFEQIKASTGIELILEDAIKMTRLTANIEAKPVHMALERLLEGSGVNYAMTFDPQDWTRVTRIFVGGGGEAPATSAAPAQRATTSRRPVRRTTARPAAPSDDYEDPEEIMDDEDFGAEDFVDDQGPDAGIEPPEEFDESFEDPSEFSAPPPSYPRSPFTPGLESSPFGSTNRQQQTQPEAAPEGEEAPPPAYYPFLDRNGRPIPVPPGTVPRQPQKKKNQ
jgi:hypothetical protein